MGGAASGNTPGGRYGAASWIDNSGNLWLFGGQGFDSTGVSGNGQGYLNDLWKFNTSTNQWAWMGGEDTVFGSGDNNSGPVYGTQGVFANGNIPGERWGATTWVDSGGIFWLFGGQGIDSSDNLGYLNDLWKFNPSTNKWAWMGGSNTGGSSGAYGKADLTASGNAPGARQFATGWVDNSGNLWLMGGTGKDSAGTSGDLNDLWVYNRTTSEWTWMGGSSLVDSSGTYGTKGTAAVANGPGGRDGAAGWADSSGNLWLFGGNGLDSTGSTGSLNDLWEYQPYILAFTAATPTFSIAAGTYSTAQKITLSDATSEAILYYTTDESTPTTSSTKYKTAIAVSKTETIKAIAVLAGYANSSVAAAAYTILQSQAITFTQPAAQTVGTPLALSAKATSGLTVSFASKTTGICTVSGTKATFIATGTCTIQATQAGNSVYAAGTAATQSFAVKGKPQTIVFTQPTTPVTWGVKAITLSASANSGLTVTISVVSGPAKISGKSLTITGAGSVMVKASQAGNSAYAAATPMARTITVNKTTLTATANDITMKKGATVPTLTYTLSGFVNGDTQAKATTGKPLLTTTATSKSAAGSYPITIKAGTLAASNYAINYVNGKVTVTK